MLQLQASTGYFYMQDRAEMFVDGTDDVQFLPSLNATDRTWSAVARSQSSRWAYGTPSITAVSVPATASVNEVSTASRRRRDT